MEQATMLRTEREMVVVEEIISKKIKTIIKFRQMNH